MDKKRYMEPEYVRFWNEHPGMPRCCFLCEHFDNPVCRKYGMAVPETFARSLDVCEDWIDRDGIPF